MKKRKKKKKDMRKEKQRRLQKFTEKHIDTEPTLSTSKQNLTINENATQ